MATISEQEQKTSIYSEQEPNLITKGHFADSAKIVSTQTPKFSYRLQLQFHQFFGPGVGNDQPFYDQN